MLITQVTNAEIVTRIKEGKSDKWLWLERLKQRKQGLLNLIPKINDEIETVDNLITLITAVDSNKSQ